MVIIIFTIIIILVQALVRRKTSNSTFKSIVLVFC